MSLLRPPDWGPESWSWGMLCPGLSYFLFILLSLTHQGLLVFTSDSLTQPTLPRVLCDPIWHWLGERSFCPNVIMFFRAIVNVPVFFLWLTKIISESPLFLVYTVAWGLEILWLSFSLMNLGIFSSLPRYEKYPQLHAPNTCPVCYKEVGLCPSSSLFASLAGLCSLLNLV